MSTVDRKERDKNLRQSDILNAAEYVFATKGYHNSTIADIAKAAQYAVGTIYIYFKDKNELYLTLIEKKTKDLMAKVKKNTENVATPYEKLKIFIKTQLEYFEENENFFRIYFSERNASRWTIKDRMSQNAIGIYLKMLDFVTDIIKEAQKGSLIKKSFDSKMLAYMLSGMVRSIILPRLILGTPKKENVDELTDFALEVFMNGAGERK